MVYTTSVPGIEQNMQETSLKYDSVTEAIFKEEITEFIKDCATQTSFFKCWAGNFWAAQPEYCTKKVRSLLTGHLASTTLKHNQRHPNEN